MKRLAILIAVIVLAGLSATNALAQRRAAPATAPQEPLRTCTMASLAGDYVFESKGSSTIAMGAAPQTFPNHLNAFYAPVAVVGRMTVGKDGAVEGIFWGAVGTGSSGEDPVVWHGNFTDLEECSGLMKYTIPIAGVSGGIGHVTERFVVVDGGQELRTAMIEFALPDKTPLPAVWNTVARRVTTANFNQQALRGVWVMTCDSLHPVSSSAMPGVTHMAESALIRLDVASNGAFTGTFDSKIGLMNNVHFPVAGVFALGEGGTVTGRMQTPAAPGMTIVAKGVLFSEGKEFLAIPVGTFDGTTLHPNGYDNCRGIRVGR